MLGFIGRWAASKGMVAVPNLIGLLNTAAQTAIANSGLTFSSSSTTNTGDSGLANKVASQTPTAGTLADYESSVSFVYYTYVAPPFFPFFPPFFPPYFAPAPFFPPYFAPAPFFPPYFAPSFTLSGVSGTATGQTTIAVSWSSQGQGSYKVILGGIQPGTNAESSYNSGIINGTGTSNSATGLLCGTNHAITVQIWSGANGTGSTLIETGASGVTTEACPVAPFFPPYFAPAPFFPPFFPPYFAPAAVYRECTSSDLSNGYCLYLGECLDATIYGTTGPICTPGGPSPFFPPFFPPYFAPAPFFPPYFAPAPFFPPYFAPAPFFPPFFPPYFAPAPFFPPYFAPAPFFPPFFPPYFAPACTEFGGPCGNCCAGLFCTTFCCGPSCSDPGCFDGGSC